LYDVLNDYLWSTVNFPGWIKGIYPILENAVSGIKDKSLFIARCNGEITGSVILNHQP
jgi:putative acetyltransferase